jgi:hypothetical protein
VDIELGGCGFDLEFGSGLENYGWMAGKALTAAPMSAGVRLTGWKAVKVVIGDFPSVENPRAGQLTLTLRRNQIESQASNRPLQTHQGING